MIAAIKNNIFYLDLRKNEFSAWKGIGHCLIALSSPQQYETFSGDLPPIPTTMSTLALHSFRKSFTILTSSLWPNVDIVRSRYEREKRELEEMIEMLEKLELCDGKPEGMTGGLKKLEMKKKGEENMKRLKDDGDERGDEDAFMKVTLIGQDVSEFQEAFKEIGEWILRECSGTTT